MNNQKLVLMLVLVAIFGAGAHFYLLSLNQTDLPVATNINNPGSTESESTTKGDDLEAANAVKKTTTDNDDSNGAKSPVTEETPSGLDDINSDLSALDTLFEETYDDSSLDAEFDQTGANSLTESYDI